MKAQTAKISNLKTPDPEAYFEKIYKEYFRRLYAYALTITKSGSMSQDIVSEVFFNLWESKKDLYAIKELKSYLFTSVKNRSISALTNNPVNFQSEDYKEVISSADQINPEELMIGNELQDFINQSIANLPPQCQLVFNMVKGQSLKQTEVAKELDISPETVKYHMCTALKKLKKDLEAHFSEARVVQWISRVIITLLAFDGLRFLLG